MKNNKGFTLVELLVAIGISAIVAASIGYLLVSSLRMYNKEITDTALQQELQVTLNQIMDYAMESEAIVLDNTGGSTKYLATGSIEKDLSNPSCIKTYFQAQIFWANNRKLYIKKARIDYSNAISNIESEIAAVNTEEKLNQCLLAEYVDTFNVSVGGIDEINNEYTNPLSVDISLEFSRDSGTKHIEKKVNDKAVLRNRIEEPIYIKPTKYKKHIEVVKSTVTEKVQMDKNAGYIKTEPVTEDVIKGDLSILEIVPEYSYDYVQFVIGGPNGALLNDVNTHYGPLAKSRGYEPVTAAEFEGYLIHSAGDAGSNDGDNSTISGYYPNIGASIKAMVGLTAKKRTGYYEYVGPEKGIYAIDHYTEELKPSDTPGYGFSRPNIVSFSHKNDGQINYYTAPYGYTTYSYNPIFEFCKSDEGSSVDYYCARKVSSGKRDYKTLNDNGFEYYEYVGDGLGDVSLEFYKYDVTQKSTYNKWGTAYKVKGDIYSYFSKDGGDYTAYISGYTTRSSNSNEEKGYDYNQTVTDVVMFSKYHTATPAFSTDYGWIYKEAENGTSDYIGINDGSLVTPVSNLVNGAFSGTNASESEKRIYLKEHYRMLVRNNELFKLFSMQDVFESYTTNPKKMLNIKNGIWDIANEKYDTVNYEALKDWEAAGHKVELNVRTPDELLETDIENADMIIVAEPTDGGFKFARGWYNAIKRKPDTEVFYTASNDISFSAAVKIYSRVIDYKTSIAMGSNCASVGGGDVSVNIARLFEMLYCVNRVSQRSDWASDPVASGEFDEIKKATYLDAQNTKKEFQGTTNYWTIDPTYQSGIESRVMSEGSGRELFSDFIKSMDANCMSNSLYSGGTLTKKTTDIIYIEENGADAGSLIVNTMSGENLDGTVYNYSGYTQKAWGDGSGSFFKNVLLKDKMRFLMDRYSRDIWDYHRNTPYVTNSDYGHEYKFYYSKPTSGIYKNQLVYNNDSPLLTFNSTGGGGLLQFQALKNNTNLNERITRDKKIGKIRVVGAGIRTPGDTSKSFEDSGVQYSIRAEQTLNGDRVVLYMSEEEYEKAGTPEDDNAGIDWWLRDGLKIYCVVSTEEPITYNQANNDNAIWYAENPEILAGKELTAQTARTLNHKYTASPSPIATYAPGAGDYENIVQEYEYGIHPLFFYHFYDLNNDITRDSTPAENRPNNKLLAMIEAEGPDGTKYRGEAEFVIVIRDTFDLD